MRAEPPLSWRRRLFSALLPTLGGPFPHIPGQSESSFTIAKQLHIPQSLPQECDRNFFPFPTRYTPNVPAELPAQSAGRPGTGWEVRARTRPVRQVTVLEVAGQLSDAVEDLDRAIQLALAEGPRGVVCDLSGVVDGAESGAVEMLATAGRHVRNWPGIPVAVACPDPQVRERLNVHSLGHHLIVTRSTFSAVSAVLSTPNLVVERLRLAAHPTAQRAARSFVARILKDWQLDRVVPFASEVVSQLVASSSVNAGTDIDLSVVWSEGFLRLTVRDQGPALPGQQPSAPDLQGRGLTTVVAGLSRTFGVLPTADGGKVVWAVLEAPRTHRSTSRRLSDSTGGDSHGEPLKNASGTRVPVSAAGVVRGGHVAPRRAQVS